MDSSGLKPILFIHQEKWFFIVYFFRFAFIQEPKLVVSVQSYNFYGFMKKTNCTGLNIQFVKCETIELIEKCQIM